MSLLVANFPPSLPHYSSLLFKKKQKEGAKRPIVYFSDGSFKKEPKQGGFVPKPSVFFENPSLRSGYLLRRFLGSFGACGRSVPSLLFLATLVMRSLRSLNFFEKASFFSNLFEECFAFRRSFAPLLLRSFFETGELRSLPSLKANTFKKVFKTSTSFGGGVRFAHFCVASQHLPSGARSLRSRSSGVNGLASLDWFRSKLLNTSSGSSTRRVLERSSSTRSREHRVGKAKRKRVLRSCYNRFASDFTY